MLPRASQPSVTVPRGLCGDWGNQPGRGSDGKRAHKAPTRNQPPLKGLCPVLSPSPPRQSTWTPQPGGALYLVGGPAAGEEVAIIVTMQRDVENVGVPVEDLLSPVAVVNILEGEKLGKRSFWQSSG